VERTANLYRIDDVLLGGAKLTAMLSPVALLAFMQHATRAGAGALPDLVALAPIALATVLCPISLWLAGRHVRSAEKRVLALHELLQSKGEVHAASLIGDTGFTRAALKRAIRLLNEERLGYYTWDARTDIIRDAHARPPPSAQARCTACGASFSFTLPGPLEAAPACSYCQAPVAADALDSLRRAAADCASRRAHDGAGSDADAPRARAFSLPVFAVLVILCWPAAIVYAVMRSRVASAPGA
jgi:hypothetical protein